MPSIQKHYSTGETKSVDWKEKITITIRAHKIAEIVLIHSPFCAINKWNYNKW